MSRELQAFMVSLTANRLRLCIHVWENQSEIQSLLFVLLLLQLLLFVQ